jgi:16S rRNA (guanine966-N2)-methyltransferase
VRPTAEHVRAALLDILQSDLEDASVLDLFAGTGALGLEALSRGARRCDFVETRPASLHALKANVVALRMKDRSRVFKKDALPFATALREGAYDLAFADPPYGSRMLDRVIAYWKANRFARVLAAEHEKTCGSGGRDAPRVRRHGNHHLSTVNRMADVRHRSPPPLELKMRSSSPTLRSSAAYRALPITGSK